ncbi:type II secretion system F family protein [Thalassobacillus sp. C254]|uniref:type II secretion system F family protein n=1 Tax=Thalassobacillus sp. C254 TaxID=1225341 RepID=UPI0006D1007C|nr:type II secretion system F family protein [Thalassobacillus sp. C254]
MIVLLLFAVFISTFLLLLLLSFALRTETVSDHSRNEPVTFKENLKNANERLKFLITRRKKPSRKKDRLEQKLQVAGIPIKAEEFVAFQVFAVLIAGGLFHLIFNHAAMLVLGGLLGLMAPAIWLKAKQKKRIRKFNEGLPGMITSVIGSLRAGFSFPQALQLAAEESYSPIKEEVEFVLKTMQYGTSLEEAFIEWRSRMPSEDLDLLVEAVLIQRQVGGNLAYLLEKIVNTTRERTKMEGQIKTLTAQGKLSGLVIGLLPFVLGIIIYMMNPDYIGTLFVHPVGQMLLVAATVGGLIGFFFIRKITTIEV